MSTKEQIEKILMKVLEIKKDLISCDKQIRVLIQESLLGTPEAEDLPSPQDGLRPSCFCCLNIMLSIEEEMEINIMDEEAERICESGTVGNLIELVENKKGGK